MGLTVLELDQAVHTALIDMHSSKDVVIEIDGRYVPLTHVGISVVEGRFVLILHPECG